MVFRPKDQYADRPLPYLIGSKEWHEKWHIGLNEEDSEESGNENNEEEDSLSSSPSPAPSLSSNVPASLSESENLSVVPTKKSGMSTQINIFVKTKPFSSFFSPLTHN